MRERDVEQYLVSEVRAIGGRAYKLACPGTNGMPDRMVCLPGGRIVFVELKAPGKQARALQRARQKALRDMGFTVFGAVDRPAMVDAIIDYCRELMGGGKK